MSEVAWEAALAQKQKDKTAWTKSPAWTAARMKLQHGVTKLEVRSWFLDEDTKVRLVKDVDRAKAKTVMDFFDHKDKMEPVLPLKSGDRDDEELVNFVELLTSSTEEEGGGWLNDAQVRALVNGVVSQETFVSWFSEQAKKADAESFFKEKMTPLKPIRNRKGYVVRIKTCLLFTELVDSVHDVQGGGTGICQRVGGERQGVSGAA